MTGYSSVNTQEKLYFMLDNLKEMAKDLPMKYQQRLPFDILTSLAQVLLNDTVFEIVKELVELQHMNEMHLTKQLAEITTRHKSVKSMILNQQKIELQQAQRQGKMHVVSRLPALHKDQVTSMEEKHKKELDAFHRRILSDVDEKVQEQQTTLQAARVPGFFVTDNPTDIKIQMYIIRFIMKLGRINAQVPKHY